MPKVLNTETNKTEEISQDELMPSLSSGKYDLLPGDSVNVLNPEGQVVSIPSDKAYDAVSNFGYKIASSQDILNEENREKYGEGTANEAKAFGLAALRGASFGLSDQALTKSGLVDPETIKQLEEQNPTASTLGEIGGVAGSIALAPGGGAVGAVGRVGEGIAAKASQIAAKGASALTNPETAGVASKVLQATGALSAKALGSAVEGAAYGLGKSISEEAMGDPDLNAEKVLSNIGHGAFIGGALGAMFKAGEYALPKAYDTAKSALGKLYDIAVGTEETGPGIATKAYAKASSFVSGKSEGEILDAFQDRVRSLADAEAQKKAVSKFAEGMQNQWDEIKKATKAVYKDVRPEEIKRSLESMPREAAENEFVRVGDSVDKVIKTMEEKPSIYPSFAREKLKELQTDFLKGINEKSTSAEIFESINAFKKNASEQLKLFKGTPSPEWREASNILNGLVNNVKVSLENENTWGAIAARQNAFNEAMSDFLTLTNTGTKKGDFIKAFMSPRSAKGGVEYRVDPQKLMTFYRQINDVRGELKNSILGDYLEASNNLLKEIEASYKSVPEKSFDRASIESIINKNKDFAEKTLEQAEFQKTLNSLAAGAHNVPISEGGALLAGAVSHPAVGAAIETWNMLKAPGLAIQRLAKIERAVQQTTKVIDSGTKSVFKKAGEVSKPFTGEAAKQIIPESYEDRKKKYQKTTSQLLEMSNNPEMFVDNLTNSTSELHDVAPKISQGLMNSSVRAVQFLTSKIPSEPEKAPLSADYDPPVSEMMRFERYTNTVNKPLDVINQIKAGTITKEAVEAISTVYPSLYAEISKSLLDQVASLSSKKEKFTIPYSTKMALSVFLGQDLDNSLSSNNIASNQMVLMSNKAKDDAIKSQQLSGGSAIPQKAAKDITLSERSLTPLQAASQRGVS